MAEFRKAKHVTIFIEKVRVDREVDWGRLLHKVALLMEQFIKPEKLQSGLGQRQAC